jgi:hypothetical protein
MIDDQIHYSTEQANEDAETALELLDAVGAFECNDCAMAVERLVGYAEHNGYGDDVVGPLKAHVAAAYALAATEGPARDAVLKMIEVQGA